MYLWEGLGIDWICICEFVALNGLNPISSWGFCFQYQILSFENQQLRIPDVSDGYSAQGWAFICTTLPKFRNCFHKNGLINFLSNWPTCVRTGLFFLLEKEGGSFLPCWMTTLHNGRLSVCYCPLFCLFVFSDLQEHYCVVWIWRMIYRVRTIWK
jgi:hypothetical protein